MITISKEQNALTLVSLFTVAPEKQDELINLLVSCTDEFIASCPGFISATYHKSLDGNNVALYAQYENMEAFQGVINSEGGKRMITEGSKIALSSQRFLCTVFDTREANSK
ncbi:antibiotic biosynthesis monooxygenase [Flavobacterium cupreum]|uniref:Antibiotic biosynthesis monooxygenase n=2 Tax=Flavobacterium TaxID=237 RepID=A0A4Y7UEH1_9FLAO|nr:MULTISPECIES: antibiotic biosynthesis monooxygenase family protein [Flavobacterium]RUT67923.1 antibiotic biosynthesis monooxygenase [Flavobacterium cupreum]TCN59477.1 antibiotic biosynthesis monooxygenase [Flavobacterium circumlabens]TEB44776.1 antibiotic biosynthesis monooxygenase [Flavobacterium circumlabens]